MYIYRYIDGKSSIDGGLNGINGGIDWVYLTQFLGNRKIAALNGVVHRENDLTFQGLVLEITNFSGFQWRLVGFQHTWRIIPLI